MADPQADGTPALPRVDVALPTVAPTVVYALVTLEGRVVTTQMAEVDAHALRVELVRLLEREYAVVPCTLVPKEG